MHISHPSSMSSLSMTLLMSTISDHRRDQRHKRTALYPILIAIHLNNPTAQIFVNTSKVQEDTMEDLVIFADNAGYGLNALWLGYGHQEEAGAGLGVLLSF